MVIVKKRNSWALFFFVILGALIGGAAAKVLSIFFPTGQLQQILTNTLDIGIYPPTTIDFFIFTVTVGFQVKLNFFLLVGTLLGVYLYRHV